MKKKFSLLTFFFYCEASSGQRNDHPLRCRFMHVELSQPNYHVIQELKLYECEAREMGQSVICMLSLSMRIQAQIPSIHSKSQHGRPSVYSSTRETER